MSTGGRSTTASDGDELDELVFECLEQIEREGAQALDALCSAHPELAAELRRRIRALESSGLIEMSPASRDDFPDELGEFRLLERLGDGELGVVYRANEPASEREFAVKLIWPERWGDPTRRSAWQHEAERASAISHPVLVPAYSFGERAGVAFRASELLHGVTLRKALVAIGMRTPETLSASDLWSQLEAHGEVARDPEFAHATWVETSVRIVLPIARALEHVHSLGLVHGSVRATNVWLELGERVRLDELGLATLRAGKRPLERSDDVFGLGAMLYELLTLSSPFACTSRERRRKLAEFHSGVPESLARVVLLALEPDPALRLESSARFAHELEDFLAGHTSSLREPGIWTRARRWFARRVDRGPISR